MRYFVMIGFVALLAACGADGDPLRPTANLGVHFGSDGVSQSVGVGAANSNFSIGVNM